MTAAAAVRQEAATRGRRWERRDRPVLRLLGAEAAAELAGRVSTARELGRRREERRRDAFPTGLEPLDRLLEGGLPRGALVELVGRPGSGRFASVLGTLATATAAGEAAALVDLGDHLDPASAAALGLHLDRLLWVRPRHLREALAAAETLLNGGFPLVVVDLGTPPVPGGRGQEAGWVRLARAAQSHGAALLVASPYRVSGTAARAVVEARPERPTYVPGTRSASRHAPPPLLAGVAVRLTLEKSRGRNGGDREEARLLLPETMLAEPLAPPEPDRVQQEVVGQEVVRQGVVRQDPALAPAPAPAAAPLGPELGPEPGPHRRDPGDGLGDLLFQPPWIPPAAATEEAPAAPAG